MEQNQDHVLYLFGAGASARALPVVDRIPHDMKEVANKLQNGDGQIKIHEEVTKIVNPIVAALHELADAVLADADEDKKNEQVPITVDEYISDLEKGINLSKAFEKKYKKSKNTLAIYVLLRQFFNADKTIKIEARYGDWLREIARNKDSKQFEEKVRVLTWNYDFQMELAYHRHFSDGKLAVSHVFDIFSGQTPPMSSAQESSPQPVGMHLNGVAEADREGAERCYQDFTKPFFHNLFELLPPNSKFSSSPWGGKLLIELLVISRFYNVKFHWDIEDLEGLEKRIRTMLQKVVRVVVVGYSFPACNQRADKLIVDCLKDKIAKLPGRSSRQLKIYIQDPNADEVADKVIKRFGFPKENIETITDKRDFYVPDFLMA